MKYYTAFTKDGRSWTPSYSAGVDKEKCSGCGMCGKARPKIIFHGSLLKSTTSGPAAQRSARLQKLDFG